MRQDYEKEFEWFMKAAEQGYAIAQNNVAYLYMNGEGVRQDYDQAYKWCKMAVENGMIEAEETLREIESKMK